MKKILLFAAAGLFGTAAFAQGWDASQWGKNQQSFNANCSFEYNSTNTELTVTFDSPNDASKGLYRFEVANKVPVTVGGDNAVLLFKVSYTDCQMLNFDQNVIYVRRQMRNGSDSDAAAIEPSFITDQNKVAGRKAGNTDNTVAYGWRYLPSLPAASGSVDWAKSFEVPSSFANNKAFTFDGDENTYGFSYVGVRICHTKNAGADTAPYDLADGAKATFSYIGVADVNKLGDDFANMNNTQQGNAVKTYIETMLGGNAAVGDVAEEGNIRVSVNGNSIVAVGATEVEVYSLTGAKVAIVAGEQATVKPGVYVVRAANAQGVETSKVIVK